VHVEGTALNCWNENIYRTLHDILKRVIIETFVICVLGAEVKLYMCKHVHLFAD
jgi:hypothetical protein